ncbi:hypothetical protein BRADO7067 [Bradyrhizobium sp. ORS 278]|nr:hypothetical protein BRADO7067 [Bradyrhizobium sp. ORS 278]
MRSVRRINELSDANRLLREKVVSLLVEIEVLREQADDLDPSAENYHTCRGRRWRRSH